MSNTPIGSMRARRGVSFGLLDLEALVSCVRASDAWYQIAAENDGSSAFMAMAGSNVARIQDRTGSLNRLFVEGSRTNSRLQSRDLTTTWNAGSAVTTTADVGNGPDGTAVADRSNISSGGHSVYRSAGLAGPYTASQWARATSGTAFCRISLRNDANAVEAGCFLERTLTTTYEHMECTRHSGGTAYLHMPCDVQLDYTGVGGTGNSASDFRSDMHQFEVGHFASSFIATTTGTATRSADTCTIPSASVPTWLRDGKWKTTVALECSSANLILHATEMTLFAFGTGTGDRIALIIDGGAIKVRVVQGGATKVTTGAITFSRWQDLTLTFDAAGSITVAGASSGNGTTTDTSWAMQSGDLYLGTTSTGTTPYFGEIDTMIREVA